MERQQVAQLADALVVGALYTGTAYLEVLDLPKQEKLRR